MSKSEKLLKLVPLRNSLKQLSKFEQIANQIVEYIKQIPNLSNEKNNLELIALVCNCIEFLCKKKYKINKENLLIYALKKALGEEFSQEDEVLVKKHIEYLHSNKLIKTVSKITITGEFLKGFFLKPNSSKD
jgi:hemoglobin-like flavoprotein